MELELQWMNIFQELLKTDRQILAAVQANAKSTQELLTEFRELKKAIEDRLKVVGVGIDLGKPTSR